MNVYEQMKLGVLLIAGIVLITKSNQIGVDLTGNGTRLSNDLVPEERDNAWTIDTTICMHCLGSVVLSAKSTGNRDCSTECMKMNWHPKMTGGTCTNIGGDKNPKCYCECTALINGDGSPISDGTTPRFTKVLLSKAVDILGWDLRYDRLKKAMEIIELLNVQYRDVKSELDCQDIPINHEITQTIDGINKKLTVVLELVNDLETSMTIESSESISSKEKQIIGTISELKNEIKLLANKKREILSEKRKQHETEAAENIKRMDHLYKDHLKNAVGQFICIDYVGFGANPPEHKGNAGCEIECMKLNWHPKMEGGSCRSVEGIEYPMCHCEYTALMNKDKDQSPIPDGGTPTITRVLFTEAAKEIGWDLHYDRMKKVGEIIEALQTQLHAVETQFNYKDTPKSDEIGQKIVEIKNKLTAVLGVANDLQKPMKIGSSESISSKEGRMTATIYKVKNEIQLLANKKDEILSEKRQGHQMEDTDMKRRIDNLEKENKELKASMRELCVQSGVDIPVENPPKEAENSGIIGRSIGATCRNICAAALKMIIPGMFMPKFSMSQLAMVNIPFSVLPGMPTTKISLPKMPISKPSIPDMSKMKLPSTSQIVTMAEHATKKLGERCEEDLGMEGMPGGAQNPKEDMKSK